MGDRITAEAASVSPPTNAIYERKTVTTSEAFQLPAACKDSWVTVQAQDVDVWCRFGAATATVTTTVTSTISSNVILAGTNAGWHVPAGNEKHFNLGEMSLDRSSATALPWFAHISKSTAGRVRIVKSSGNP